MFDASSNSCPFPPPGKNNKSIQGESEEVGRPELEDGQKSDKTLANREAEK